MQIKEISEGKATVWFARDELTFMIAAAERALGKIDPDEFSVRTGRTVDYANAILAELYAAIGVKKDAHPHQVDDPAYGNSNDSEASRRLRVTIRVELIADDKALVSLSDWELCFLNNAINEAIHGIRGVEEFERSSGKTSKYGRRLMQQLAAANDKVESLS